MCVQMLSETCDNYYKIGLTFFFEALASDSFVHVILFFRCHSIEVSHYSVAEEAAKKAVEFLLKNI